MLVYERVRDYLENRGIKQSFVADKIGMSMSTFNAIMCGTRKLYAEDLRAVCYALQVSPEEFIEHKRE